MGGRRELEEGRERNGVSGPCAGVLPPSEKLQILFGSGSVAVWVSLKKEVREGEKAIKTLNTVKALLIKW